MFAKDGFVRNMDSKFLSHDNHIYSYEVFDIKISDSTLSNSSILTSFMNKARYTASQI